MLAMATAVMARGRFAQPRAAGKDLPAGVALTADGEGIAIDQIATDIPDGQPDPGCV